MSPCCQTPAHLTRIREIKNNRPSNRQEMPIPFTLQEVRPYPVLPFDMMTPVLKPIMKLPEGVEVPAVPSGPQPEIPSIGEVTSDLPYYEVPLSPSLPPGSTEYLSYSDIQYLLSFLKTQIGRYVMVEQLLGSNRIAKRHGYLLGIGTNYLYMQDAVTGNIGILDGYTLKYMYVFYNIPSLDELAEFEEDIAD